MTNVSNIIQKLVKAEKDLREASASVPPHINRATIKLQEKANIEYFEALSIIGEALDFSGKNKTVTQKGFSKSFGGNVHPKDTNEIKKRIENKKGRKQECYKAALELLQKEGKWVTKREFYKLGIKIMDTPFIKLRQRINACLPTGYILQTNGHGRYKATKYAK